MNDRPFASRAALWVVLVVAALAVCDWLIPGWSAWDSLDVLWRTLVDLAFR